MKCKDCTVSYCQYRTTNAEKDCYYEQWKAKQFDWQYHLYVTHGDTSIKNKETPYIYNKTQLIKKTETLDDVKNLFVDFISNSGVKFQSIRVNQSIYSNFN